MSLPIVLRHEASRDTEEIRNFLNHRKTGLGQDFINRLNEKLRQIGEMPESYSVVWSNVRATRLKRYRYVVYYRIFSDRVEVLAVVHSSRNSSSWKSRL